MTEETVCQSRSQKFWLHWSGAEMKMLETILCSFHAVEVEVDHIYTVLYGAHSGGMLALPRYILRDACDIAGNRIAISCG